jgi:hypothetical protein
LKVHGIAAVLKDVHLRNADDDLIAVIAQAENRQSEIDRTNVATTPAYANKYSRSLYQKPASVGADRNVSER